jgi:hypothetical protein
VRLIVWRGEASDWAGLRPKGLRECSPAGAGLSLRGLGIYGKGAFRAVSATEIGALIQGVFASKWSLRILLPRL